MDGRKTSRSWTIFTSGKWSTSAAVMPQTVQSIILPRYCVSTAVVQHTPDLLQYCSNYLICNTASTNFIAAV
jgi:hypothetical protein